jgi:hypothetical protein
MTDRGIELMAEPNIRRCEHQWVEVLDRNGVILFSVCSLCLTRLGPPPWYIQMEEKPHSVDEVLLERELEISRALICMAFGINPDVLLRSRYD